MNKPDFSSPRTVHFKIYGNYRFQSIISLSARGLLVTNKTKFIKKTFKWRQVSWPGARHLAIKRDAVYREKLSKAIKFTPAQEDRNFNVTTNILKAISDAHRENPTSSTSLPSNHSKLNFGSMLLTARINQRRRRKHTKRPENIICLLKARPNWESCMLVRHFYVKILSLCLKIVER